MSIVVFGSINMDLVARVPHFLKPGETLTGSSFQTFPGGKGANQAVACARLGAQTKIVGRVGSDAFGRTLIDHLIKDGVDTTFLYEDPSHHSGVALIAVNELAENQIIVVPGANGAVGAEDLRRLETALQDAKILLLQLEVPMPTVTQAAQMAHRRGISVILDPAPAQPLPEELLLNTDFITPNQVEAAMLVGFPIMTEKDALAACRQLQAKGVKNVLIKMGAEGVFACTPDICSHFPAIPVQAVDTVAAGDAFNGAFAAALSDGISFEQAIRWGTAAGAWSVTRPGAQTSLPTRDEMLSLLSGSR